MKTPLNSNVSVVSQPIATTRTHPDGSVDNGSTTTTFNRIDIRSGSDSPLLRPTKFKPSYRLVSTIDQLTRKVRKFRLYEPNPYAVLRSKRKLLPNNYSNYSYLLAPGSKQVLHSSDGWSYDAPWTNGQDGFATLGSKTVNTWLPYPVWDSNDDLRLLDDLKSQMRGSEFDLGVFLGEGKESLALIASTATRVHKTLAALKHGNVKEAVFQISGHTPAKYTRAEQKLVSRPFKTAADNWLALQYGYIPLLSDVKAAAEYLSARLNHPCYIRYVSRKKKTMSKTELYALVNPLCIPIQGTSSDFRGAGQLFSEWKQQIVAYVKEDQSDIDKASNLSLVDPLTVAWELTPYSFVADWFVPIGTFLSNRSFFSNLKGTFVTSRLARRGLVNPRLMNATFDFKNVEVSFVRSVSTSLNVPFPTVKPLSAVPSWQHCANALALVTGFFKS